MKGCWDPEFKPSVEEIVMAILSVRFLWQVCTPGGGGGGGGGEIPLFSLAHSQARSGSHLGQPAHAAHPNII